jgi:hypothetical protein
MQLDLTRPNSGRMIDYWLGGSHNFEIDRQMADQVAGRFPIIKQIIPETRTLVKRGVQYFRAHGIRAILDFGAGLPTCDNTHTVAHALDPTIKVVYSDIDPITVAYGQELLQGNSNAIYLQCDAMDPRTALDSAAACQFLGDERRVGIIFLNLAHAMDDDQIRASWLALYVWAVPGSFLFMSNASENWNTDPELIAVREVYGRANLTGYFRSPAEIRALAHPWQGTPEGIVNLLAWHNSQPSVALSQLLGYAAMLYK